MQGKMDIVLMLGRVLSDGRMSARVKYDVNDRFSIKANAQVRLILKLCFHSRIEVGGLKKLW